MENEKKDKTKSIKLYNISVSKYPCMWNESDWKLFVVKISITQYLHLYGHVI